MVTVLLAAADVAGVVVVVVSTYVDAVIVWYGMVLCMVVADDQVNIVSRNSGV